MIQLLRKLLHWLDPVFDEKKIERAKSLINSAQLIKSSSEYKRHHVYSQLIKELPDTRKRDIAYLIEYVYRTWY